MKAYRVSFAAAGSVIIEAESEQDALDKFHNDPEWQTAAGEQLARQVAQNGFDSADAEECDDE